MKVRADDCRSWKRVMANRTTREKFEALSSKEIPIVVRPTLVLDVGKIGSPYESTKVTQLPVGYEI